MELDIKTIVEEIIDNYELPDNFVKRYNSLYSMQVIDLEAINKYVVTTDVKYKEIKIDSDLEKVIMDGFPYDASELEMAIYIYIIRVTFYKAYCIQLFICRINIMTFKLW